ncbi:MAG: hypothetical protein WCO99_11760 [Planctomycetota bacterium]
MSAIAATLEALRAGAAAFAGRDSAAGGARPVDGTLPWMFRTGLDPQREPHWLERVWFAAVAVEVPLDAADLEAFATRARGLPAALANYRRRLRTRGPVGAGASGLAGVSLNFSGWPVSS